jgi:hypothetical protein
MSPTNAPTGTGVDESTAIAGRNRPATTTREHPRRLSTETKAAFKTTEFAMYVVLLVGVLIAGAVTKASHYAGRHDVFRADRVWLYATILTVGYMVSRGIAKAGSRQPYDESS